MKPVRPCDFCLAFRINAYCDEYCIYRNAVAEGDLPPGDYYIIESIFGYELVNRWFTQCLEQNRGLLLRSLSYEAHAKHIIDPVGGVFAIAVAMNQTNVTLDEANAVLNLNIQMLMQTNAALRVENQNLREALQQQNQQQQNPGDIAVLKKAKVQIMGFEGL